MDGIADRAAMPAEGAVAPVDTFVLGLTMAGAISGGAYTAGVLSFLAEALDAWEAARSRGGAEAPPYRVVLKAISGASAGSICGALGAISLLERQSGTEDDAREGTTESGAKVAIPLRLPRLYAAWVEGPCLLHPDGTEADLLGVRDLKKRRALVSLLDSTRLDDVAAAGVAPMAEAAAWRPWVDPRLHLYMTHTDMRGVPYRIAFTGGLADADHGMLAHADRVHYVLKAGAAAPPVPDNAWAAEDVTPAEELDLPVLLRQPGTPAELTTLAEATLASSAFPFGFTARHLRHRATRWDLRPMPSARVTSAGTESWLRLSASWTSHAPWPGDPARTTIWDGGCLDNEPFQYARWAIMQAPPQPESAARAETDRAVVMIDPFPEPPAMPGWGVDGPEPALLAVARRALGVFVNAARFKPEEIAAALDRNVYSRFLVAPQRQAPGAPRDAAALSGGAALASGGLGGFGGTIAERFRLHDFQLGRRNCQHFLRRHFALPEANPLFAGGAPPGGGTARPGHRPIVPLDAALGAELPQLAWPRLSEEELDELLDRADLRLEAVVDRVIADLGSALQRWAARRAWSFFARDAARAQLRWTLFRDLLLRDQITGWSGHGTGLEAAEDTERAVLWLLADPSFDARSEAALARHIGERPRDQELFDRNVPSRRLGRVTLLHPRGGADLAEALSRMQALGWVATLPGRPGIWHLRRRPPGMLANLLGQLTVET